MIRNQIGLLVLIVAVTGCSFLSKKGNTNSNSNSNSNNTSSSNSSSSTNGAAGLTRENYEKMEMGISYDEVVRLLGSPGTESARYTANTATVVTYKWEGDNHARISATFSNGKLTFKTRANLK